MTDQAPPAPLLLLKLALKSAQIFLMICCNLQPDFPPKYSKQNVNNEQAREFIICYRVGVGESEWEGREGVKYFLLILATGRDYH